WLRVNRQRLVFFLNKFDATVRLFNHLASGENIDLYSTDAYDSYIQNLVRYSDIIDQDPDLLEVKKIIRNFLFRNGSENIDELDILLPTWLEGLIIANTDEEGRLQEIQWNELFDQAQYKIRSWLVGRRSIPGLILDDNYEINGVYQSDIFYAKEDVFDQVLCRLAIRAGYDVVFLEKMPGK